MRILLLEDEYALRLTVMEFLEDIGFTVEGFEHSDAAMDAVFEKPYDLMLLDVKVPGVTGFEFLKMVRESGVQIPAIFMTSLTQGQDMVKGYDCGCCDYIKKPFDLTELQVRVEHAIKRECLNTDEASIQLPNGYRYDAKRFKLTLDGEEVVLTGKERKILELLVQNRGRVVTAEEFHDGVWGEYVDPSNVRVHVNKLRKKLTYDFIKNVRGLGYMIDS